MDWKTLLAYISGSVDEELLNRNEYLAAENRILRDKIKGRVQLSNAERQTLAEIGKKLQIPPDLVVKFQAIDIAELI